MENLIIDSEKNNPEGILKTDFKEKGLNGFPSGQSQEGDVMNEKTSISSTPIEKGLKGLSLGQSQGGDVMKRKTSTSYTSFENGTTDFENGATGQSTSSEFENSVPPDVIKSTLEYIAKRNAISAAESAIMGRNMSHNLGSHVLSYTINKITSGETLSDSYICGIAHLLQYIQERQDFIASVATQHVPYFSPVEFKEIIFDFINPDKVAKRHDPKHPVDNIILDTIARSEGYRHYSGTEDESQKSQEDNQKKPQLRVAYYDRMAEKIIYGDTIEEMNPLRSKAFMLAGGIMGRQAIMSIVENLIRNAAKHEKPKNELTLFIELLTKEQLLKYLVTTDKAKECYDKADDNDALDYFVFSYPVTDVEKSTETVKLLQEAIVQRFIDKKDYGLLDTNKGIKELRISASWLRGDFDEEKYRQITTNSDDDSTDSHDEKGNLAPLLWVQTGKINNINVIQYIVGVRKLFRLAIIGVDGLHPFIANAIKYEYEINGKKESKIYDDIICYESVDEYNKDKYSNCAEYTVVASEDVKKAIQSTSYGRIVVLDNFTDYIGKELTKDKLLRIVYASFAGQRFEETPPSIIIDDSENIEQLLLTLQGCTLPVEEASSREHNYYEYLYKRHLDCKGNIELFIEDIREEFYPNLKFAESITGSNSTFRMIFHQKKDEKWYYEQLAAMKCKIAIFDERIYQDKESDDQAWFMKFKGVYCFNIEEIGEDFYIRGYRRGMTFDAKQDHIIGKIMVDNCSPNIIDFNFSSEGENQEDKQEWKLFDFISIHQGLIDKLCNRLGGHCEDNCRKIIKLLYSIFAKASPDEQQDIFPGMIVHSGRGKVSKGNMPLKLPFIPYSSLKNAVNDCKYTLFNLLTFAKYE